jgi:bacterioferritin-associated ferredoxin
VVLVGAGPLLPLVTHQYLSAGAEVVASLDVTGFLPKVVNGLGLLWAPWTLTKGLWYMARNLARGLLPRFGVKGLRVEGDDRVEALVWTDAGGREHRVECDAVGASFGLNSEIQLADLAGCRMRFEPETHQWQPERSPEGRSSVPGIYLAGDGTAIGGADVAEAAGERTALTLISDLGRPIDRARVAVLDRRLARHRRFRAALEAAYPFPAHLLDDLPDAEPICRCEGITVGTLRDVARRRDVDEVNRLKAFTRIGMGRCQGRVCGRAAAEILARTIDRDLAAVGRLRSNPPVKPIPIEEVP